MRPWDTLTRSIDSCGSVEEFSNLISSNCLAFDSVVFHVRRVTWRRGGDEFVESRLFVNVVNDVIIVDHYVVAPPDAVHKVSAKM